MDAAAPVLRVDIVSDVVCPWCVIGFRQLATAATELGVMLELQWHPFELNPGMGPEGQDTREHLVEKYDTTPEQSKAARENLQATGQELGFTFNYAEGARIWNTFRAHQLIDYAETFDRAHHLKIALFYAYFTDGLNISDIEVLTTIAEQQGLDPTEARRVLESETRAPAVRQKEKAWVDSGITGVPAMIFAGEHLVVGAQGIENYRKILTHLTSAEVV